VVGEVNCAVDIQKELKLRNDKLRTCRKMKLRIGVNPGDVIEDGQRLGFYGDGVNIAARVECLADGEGICISKDGF
jgi:adenylate cyclase